MVKIAKGLSWKPLSLKSRVLSHNLDLDGLIGVEELTDYQLDKVCIYVWIVSTALRQTFNYKV